MMPRSAKAKHHRDGQHAVRSWIQDAAEFCDLIPARAQVAVKEVTDASNGSAAIAQPSLFRHEKHGEHHE